MQDALQMCRDEFSRTANLMRSMVALQADMIRKRADLVAPAGTLDEAA